MKLAILGARGIPARYGGFETFAEQIAVRLVERGHEITVFCEATENALEEHKGVKLRYVLARNFGPLTTIAYDAACLWQTRSSFDVIYMLGYGSSAFCWLPRLWGTEVWINMDGLEWARSKWGAVARFYFRCAEKIAMRTANRIVADAAAIEANLASRHKRMPPCDVIPYGCELLDNARVEELAPLGLTARSYYLVVCRFEPENHVREIVEGFLASKSHAKLVLVGDDKRTSKYVQLLRRYVDERLVFAGAIYDKAKIQALRYFCRAYLHGHSVGGTNPSLLEAMGCGNVVIAHDNPFNREVLGPSALFFSGPCEVATAIDAVDLGAMDLAALKSAVIHRVGQYYTWDRITDHYCELLSLVSSGVQGPDVVIQRAPHFSRRASRT